MAATVFEVRKQCHDKVYTIIEHMLKHFCNQLVLDFIPQPIWFTFP